jgi:ribosome biogenesis protein MAK21
MPRFEEQLGTIFEVTHSSNFNTSIQAMMLIQQISATKHISADRFYRTLYESLLDPRLITTSKHILYLNLLYRALKADVSIRRVKAFVKRLLQIIHLHEPPFICGVLYLIKELITTFPSIKAMLSTPEDNESDTEEEHYEDVPEEGAPVKENGGPKHPLYDPRKRDPEHANAELSCLWELLPLQAHYHPSVHVLASKLLNQQPITEKPDPTVYTLMNFLDKFAFRNAKSKPQAAHGTSIMQPMSGTSKAADYLITVRDGDRLHDPVNSEQFWKKKVEEVREDEVFFHTYFEKAGKAKHASMKDKKRKRAHEEDEEESGEEEIWKALVNSRPDIEGDDEDDEGFSDMDMDDMSDDLEGDGGMDGGVELNLGSDAEDDEVKAGEQQGEDDDDDLGDDGFDLDDEDAFMDSDEDIPIDMDMNDDTDVEENLPSSKSKKDKDKAEKGRKKRKLKHLPTFASVDDYAKLIGDDDTE